MNRTVVTGGAGFVGAHLCAALLDREAEVVCVDNFVTSSPDNVADLLGRSGFSVVECDVCEELTVPGPVDVVFHLASPASPVDYLRLPVETMRAGSTGTMHALELAREKGARFILASTSEVYGDPIQHPQREDYWGNVNPNGPRAVYDEAKRFAEALTGAYRTRYGVDTGIVRLFNSYGPKMRPDDGRAIPTFIGQALGGESLTVAGDGSQTRSLCYVADTVEGLIAMAESGEAGPVNIGGDDEITILTLARTVREVLRSTSEIVFVDLPENDPHVRRPDLSRARRLLGWEPQVTLADGLSRTVEWFVRSAAHSAPSRNGDAGVRVATARSTSST